MRAVGVAAGGAASAGINKFLPNLSPKVRAIGKMVVGIVLPELAPKNQMLSDAGIAFAGTGAADLANQLIGGTGVQGIGDPEYVVNGNDEYAVNGDGDYVFGNENDAMGSSNEALGNGNDALGDVENY